MADIKPFKGLRFNLEKTVLKQVLAPPYDIISNEKKEALKLKSPYNIVKLLIPEPENKYTEASNLLNTWQTDQILVEDKSPSFYLYEQEYEFDNKKYSRVGFIGIAKIEDFENNIILPHEKIAPNPVENRFNLLKECKANLSPIFSLYLDPEKKLDKLFHNIKKTMPAASAVDDEGIKNTLWLISEEKDIKYLVDFMKDKKLYIADGHQRYKAALEYRKMMRNINKDSPDDTKNYDFVLMMFVNFYDNGLRIFPTHRVIEIDDSFDINKFITDVKKFFEIEMIDSESNIEEFFSDKLPTKVIIYFKGSYYGIVLKDEFFEKLHPIYRKINTYILHEFIIKNCPYIKEDNILYVHKLEEVKKLCNNKKAIAFLLPAIDINLLREIAENNLIMPQKSTYFYPKLSSGLVIYKHS